MAAQPGVASGLLLEANSDACQLLDQLSGEAKAGRKVNQYFVNHSQALIFMWTMKAGLGIGLSTGGGFMVSRLSGKKWSAPLFLKATAGQAGFIIGVEKMATIMGATAHSVIQEVIAGRTAVLGSDLSIQVWPLVQGGTAEASQMLSDAWNACDLVSISHGQGMIVDYSFKGGAITLDTSKNAECYGAAASTEDIVMGAVEAPSEMAPLIAKLEELSKGA